MRKKTVLLVEDDAIVRDIIRSALEREYEVLEAAGCAEAKRMQKNAFDIALVDYMLPDGNGIDILKAVRKVKPEVPVIIMTAYNSEEVLLKALRAAATDYVKKPLILSHLRKKVANLLEGRNEEDHTKASVSREEFLLDGIEAFLEDHYSEDITRDQLAEKVCMNKYAFSKAFNERFGQNIKSYLNAVRVNKAAELLRNNDLSVREIAFSVGFQNVEHFFKVFKEIYGVSPKEYQAAPSGNTAKVRPLWQMD